MHDPPSPLSPPPLALVTYALVRIDARLAPLAHVTALLSELLDLSVLRTPVDAAASGSVRLFDRVYHRVAHDPRIDPALRTHWLARALHVALEHDDLRMAQRVHACHPGPLYVHAPIAPPSLYGSTLGLALRYGSLETVQWVVEHRRDRLCCPTGARNLCFGCLLAALPCLGDTDPFGIFCWLIERGVFPTLTTERTVSRLWDFMIRSVGVVQWLHERRLLSRSTGEMVLSRAVEDGNTSIVKYLLAVGVRIRSEKHAQRKLIHAACFGHAGVVAALLASDQCRSFQHKFQWEAIDTGDEKLLRWHPDAMHERINGSETVLDAMRNDASRAGNRRILQWLYHEHSTPPSLWHLQNHTKPQDALLRVYQWMVAAGIAECSCDAMDTASRDGFLDVVQWLHLHASDGVTTRAMDDAASNGHLRVVQWLHANRTEGCSKQTIIAAARNGHLRVVRWLLTNRQELHVHVNEAKTHAAAGGHLDVLVWLCGLESTACTKCLTRAVLHQKPVRATAPPSPDVLSWVHAQFQAFCKDCIDVDAADSDVRSSHSDAAISAAYSGDLNLIKRLHALDVRETRLLLRERTVRRVAQTGHLAVLQWISETFQRSDRGESEGSDGQWNGDWAAALGDARASGFDRVVAWIESLRRPGDETSR